MLAVSEFRYPQFCPLARAAEVLVQGDEFYVIRSRETYETLIQGENIPEFLK